MFSEQLSEVRRRIADACARAGRDPSGVRILPVTKTFGPDAVREAAECGLDAFGENRVQEARQKIPLCPDHLVWHLIGHLQSNKVREAVALFEVIHSVDSARLLGLVDAAAEAAGRRPTVLLEVNVSGEGSKFGLSPDGVAAVLEGADRLMNVNVAGLMTIPPFNPEPEAVRPFFRALRELRDRLALAGGRPLPQLSMGMSHDFETAVEEGATTVRLGSILFGKRPRPAPAGGEE